MARLVSSVDDSWALHLVSKLYIPNMEDMKPSTIWVGVIRIDHGRQDELRSEDFVWIKAKGSVTVLKLRDAYQAKQANQLRGVDWEFNFWGNASRPIEHRNDTTMAELDHFGDQCIIAEAAKVQRQVPAVSRQQISQTHPIALQPKSPNRQLAKQPLRVDDKPNIASKVSPAPPQSVHINGSPGFELYVATFSAEARRCLPTGFSAPDIERDLFSRWWCLPPDGRNYYEQQARAENTHHGINFHHGPVPLPGPIPLPGAIPLPGPVPFPGAVPVPGAVPLPTPATLPASSSNVEPELVVDEQPSLKNVSPSKQSELDSGSQAAGGEEQKSFRLQSLLKHADLEMLERGVGEGVGLLDDLKAPLIEKMADSPDAEQWLQQIETLKKQAVKTKTVIGVVGNTGAGKSSVINAMLDEERLVPTNCMRACTAVVTEISYNHEPEPYHAQIEFITSADWERELKTLFEDLLDGDGRISRDCTNEDTDAGIAYAKIKAVYPKKTREDISKSSPTKMLQEVNHILGTKRIIKETDSLLFYKKLQSYVDSKEKSASKKDTDRSGDKRKEPLQMEFWPLIRVVRINVKSAALATGAIIVDLPGVHDANAARAAVAEGYMKQCTGLWIVAPINRAVDDKAAKSLLGESFKRQLKMDGGFSAVTFICSKTDDISLEEAQESLGLDDQVSSSWEKIDQLVKKQRSLKSQIEEMLDAKATFGEAQDIADAQIEVWEGLRDDFEAGKPVFAPEEKCRTKKRKGYRHDDSSRKKRRINSGDADDDEDFIDDESDRNTDILEDDNAASDKDCERPEPLTGELIAGKLQELKESKKEARTQRAEIAEQIKNLRKEIEEAKEVESNINNEMSALCISGRNEYSKRAIQQDFAAGIKEMDQELAAEEDEENFNPEVETRDYDEVARSLPVFCVSSRGYQKLQGRLKKDPHVPGFTQINETEIPQLQAHCEKLTETGRTANCRSFMNKLSQLLNSLVLWTSSDEVGANLTPEQRAKEDKHLQKGLKDLETGLEEAVESACSELDTELTENIYDRYETAVSNASEAAMQTVLHWGLKVNRDNRPEGGYAWATYKAISRRNGVYSNAQGPHDWNGTLTDPIMKIIAPGWEKTFSRRLPMVMANFTRDTAKHLKQFHKNIEGRARKIGSSIASLHMLQEQVGVYESNIKDIASVTKESIIAIQKDVNRGFTPVIEKAMGAAYTICTEERGPGSFARMKAAMNEHVAAERHFMFQRSVDEAKKCLDAMIEKTQEDLDGKVDAIFIQMRRDYRTLLGGGDAPAEGQILPKSQRLARREMLRLIEQSETRFVRAAKGEVQNDEEAGVKEEGGQEAKLKNEGHEQDEMKKSEVKESKADSDMAISKVDKVKKEEPKDS